MFKRILVAVDGSDSSLHALRQAMALARAENGAITVVSVMPPYTGDLSLVGVRENVNDMILAPHQKALDEAVETANRSGGDSSSSGDGAFQSNTECFELHPE